MKMKRVMWGLLLVLGALVLVFGKLGYFGEIKVWSLLFSGAFGVIAIMNLFKLEFAGVFFPLAFIGIIYDEELGITSITPWVILIAALLLSIGFSMIFHRNKKHYYDYKKDYKDYDEKDFEIINEKDESNVFCSTKFGASAKYINTDEFKQAELNCSFGAMKVYFDNAVMTGDSAIVKIEASFCGVELYVPKEWEVEDRLNVSLAGVTEKNKNQPNGRSKLILIGSVSLAGVDIIYV